MVLLMASILLARATDIRLFELTAYFSAGGLFILCWRLIRVREAYLLLVCAGLSAIAHFVFHKPFSVFEAGLGQASFLMAFLLLLALLHEVATTSPAVAQCGQYLTRQPPNRRYFAVYGGTNIMSVLFNLGIISLLTPLIRKGVELESGDEVIARLRERRQLTALLRGFAWGVVWSPTALTPVILIELIDGISRELWTAYGLVLAAFICVLGWAEDKWRFRHYRGTARQIRPALAFPKRAFFNFLFILSLLLGLTLLISALSGDTIVFGLLVSCPVIMLLWLLGQNADRGSGAIMPALQQCKHILFVRLTSNARVMMALAASGYIGRLSAELVPIDYFSQLIEMLPLADYQFLMLLAFVMVPVSYLAVSPIMMAVFFGSLLGALPELPVDPTFAALAISSGWALSMTTSPFATVVLMMSNLNGMRPMQLTIGWNLLFSVLAFTALSVIFFIMTGGQ